MGAFTSALALAGIGMQAYGQYKSGQDAASAAAYNASVYQQQASVIETKKGLTRQQFDRMINKLAGAQTVAIAGSGRDLSGSALEVMNDALTQAYLDKQIEIYNLDIQKNSALSASQEELRAGQAAKTSGMISAGATILTGGNAWYSKYGSQPAIPGQGGYGADTPAGVTNRRTWSEL